MTQLSAMSDLELAALMSSRICHDAISPVGAINNGLEVLDDEVDADSRKYALDLIRSGAQSAAAKLDFARFAYGASGSAGSEINLGEMERIARAYCGSIRHELEWHVEPINLPKNVVKLLLNLIASGIAALPRGGTLRVIMGGSATAPIFQIQCVGRGAKLPEDLARMLGYPVAPPTEGLGAVGADGKLVVNALSIQAYYTVRVAAETGMSLALAEDGADIIIDAR